MWGGRGAVKRVLLLTVESYYVVVQPHTALKLGAAELEHRKQCANAKARGVAPTFEKLEKWLRGIGSLIDGRIVIAEKVLEFVNKDYG